MPAVDPFKGHVDHVTDQGHRLMAITPDDANDLPRIPKALLCTVAGNICVDAVDGNLGVDGASNLGAGIIVPMGAGDTFDAVRVKRVRSTGTTATVYGVL